MHAENSPSRPKRPGRFLEKLQTSLGRRANELRLILGFPCGEVALHGQDLSAYYLGLYSDGDKAKFAASLKRAYASRHCGWVLKDILNPVFNFYRDKPLADNLSINEDRAEAAARHVATVFFGSDDGYAVARQGLSDEESKRLFDKEILLRALTETGWDADSAVRAVCTGISLEEWERLIPVAREKGYMPNFAGRSANDDYVNFARTAIFLLDQYEYKDICTLRQGDVFFDCGACFGDTAIWGMEKVGENGTVVAFEPIKGQADTMRENVGAYLESHGCNVLVEDAAVTDADGLATFSDNGSGSSSNPRGTLDVRTMSIDSYCGKHGIWPDFIKMDIEGAEMAALKGAEKTIRDRKPRLAVCVYHRPAEDLWAIPALLKSFVPEYRFYLKKSHPFWETVLFAKA